MENELESTEKNKSWRQEAFAEKIGLSVTYTGMIERGEKIPKLETFIIIATVLEASADLLLADVKTDFRPGSLFFLFTAGIKCVFYLFYLFLPPFLFTFQKNVDKSFILCYNRMNHVNL